MRKALACILLAGCFLPAEERADLDHKVGRVEGAGLSVQVAEGRAGVRSFVDDRLELWAQAPTLELTVRADGPRALTLDVLNCMPNARLTIDDGEPIEAMRVGEHAACRFELEVVDGNKLRLAPPAAQAEEPFVFAVLSDVQDAVDRVQDVFRRMNEDPELSFVVSTGDLVDTGARDELARFQRELTGLNIPLFSTVGNHEMGAPAKHWHELFGPFNVSFPYRGVTFSLIDSGNGTVDPDVYDRLDEWLRAARQRTHVVLTHVPPLDPAGLRGGSFRSRKEAAKLVQKLAEGRIDVLFLGHIHSYYAFSVAGVPSYISGGGGAIQERFDGIERHYLRVRASAARGIEDVAVVRVD